jgi:hypothetical protein
MRETHTTTLGATTSPGTQGPNFSGITWLPLTPAVDQRIFLSAVIISRTHRTTGLTVVCDF